MAISKLNFNSLNVAPTAGKAVSFDSGADDLEATLSGGSMVFIKKLTASSSGTLSFVNGASSVVLDSTYKEYVFTFKNIHASANNAEVGILGSIDSGSNYNVAKTTTHFDAGHAEDGSAIVFTYETSHDVAQGTGLHDLTRANGNANDSNACGTLHLFNPSSTTFVKHFVADMGYVYGTEYGAFRSMSAGYFNTTSAIDAIQFKMSSGNIDAGTITLYGIN